MGPPGPGALPPINFLINLELFLEDKWVYKDPQGVVSNAGGHAACR